MNRNNGDGLNFMGGHTEMVYEEGKLNLRHKINNKNKTSATTLYFLDSFTLFSFRFSLHAHGQGSFSRIGQISKSVLPNMMIIILLRT